MHRPPLTPLPPLRRAGASLDGGEGLEEFGQVDLRVAAAGQGFVGHLLQPAVDLLLLVPLLRPT